METSKTFKRIGTIVGLTVTKKTQRGILGLKFGKWYDKWFEEKMIYIKPKTIKVNSSEGVYWL